jgi:hypothetical protein
MRGGRRRSRFGERRGLRGVPSPWVRRCLPHAEPVDPIQHPFGVVSWRTAIKRVGDQAAGVGDITGLKRGDALMKNGLRFALQFRLRAAGAIDVGPRAVVMPIEKEGPRPQIDRLFVLAEKILIEPGEKQLLDAGVTLGCAQRFGTVRVGTKRGVVDGELYRDQRSGTGDQGRNSADAIRECSDP